MCRVGRLTFALILLASSIAAQDAYTELAGWRVQMGDNARYAEPGFEDSGWQRPDVFPVSHQFGPRRRKPGAQWWRTTVAIPPHWRGRPLGLGMAPLDDSYEVFVDGRLVGGSGILPPIGASGPGVAYVRRHELVPVPATQSPQMSIAIRVWSLPNPNAFRIHYVLQNPSHGPHKPVLGLRESVDLLERLHAWNASWASVLTVMILAVSMACGTCCLILWQGRKDRQLYLWLGLWLAWIPIGSLISYPMLFPAERLARNAPVSLVWTVVFTALLPMFALFLLAELYPPWRKTLRALAIPCTLATAVSNLSSWIPTPLPDLQGGWMLGAGYVLLAAGAVAWRTRREPNRRTLAFALLIGLYQLASQLSASGIVRIAIGDFSLDLRNATQLSAAIALVAIVYRQFRREQDEQRELREDLATARRVQQMLLSSSDADASSFDTQVAYLPARQVGGDLYYLSPCADGSLLVVVGDVSGKGMQAALLVSSILGSLRSSSVTAPAAVLTYLNRSLTGRTAGGFVTCCCIRINTDGTAHIANAGHCNPYIDGKEADITPGLPLGLMPDAEWDESAMPLGTATLTLLSDGVIEATNAAGELFGFDRTAALSTKPAKQIAAAAETWGQNDDITVVTIRRTGTSTEAHV